MEAIFINTYKSDAKPLTQDLYKLSNSVEYGHKNECNTDYVVASRSCVPVIDEWEIMVFPSDESGKILDWTELWCEKGWHRTSDVMNRYVKKMEKYSA